MPIAVAIHYANRAPTSAVARRLCEQNADRCIYSMISMMRTSSGSPCVIHRHQERAEFDRALARRLRMLAVNQCDGQ
jgi:hypothetical protein